MEAVEIRKADDGYWLRARADSLAEACRGVDVLLAIPSQAFVPLREAVYVSPETARSMPAPDYADDELAEPYPSGFMPPGPDNTGRYAQDTTDLPEAVAALTERLDAAEDPTRDLTAGTADLAPGQEKAP